MWQLLLPGIPIGLTLYVNKRLHLLPPKIVFPVLILGPMAIFYVRAPCPCLRKRTRRAHAYTVDTPARG